MYSRHPVSVFFINNACSELKKRKKKLPYVDALGFMTWVNPCLPLCGKKLKTWGRIFQIKIIWKNRQTSHVKSELARNILVNAL